VGLEKADGGARVISVAPDSTAAATGLIVGDVIEAVDGRPATTLMLSWRRSRVITAENPSKSIYDEIRIAAP
jgi:C-terminal processing protease CtpA/Prc